MGLSDLQRPAKDKKPSYLWEMLTHPLSSYGALSAITAGAVLSIPFGLGIGMLPLIAFAAGEGIAALFIPSHPVFKESVDKKKRAVQREEIRKHLVGEIEMRAGEEGRAIWATYHRMRERLKSFSQMVATRDTMLSVRDVERLEDATNDFLGLWLAKLVTEERERSLNEDVIRNRLADVLKQLETVTAEVEKRRLLKAQDDLEGVLSRREGLKSRAASVEAAMVAMADTFEELFQQVVTNPSSGDVTQHLNQAVQRMRIEENLDLELERELSGIVESRPHRRARAQAEKARA